MFCIDDMITSWAKASAFKHRNKSRGSSSTSGRAVWGGSGPRSGYLHNAPLGRCFRHAQQGEDPGADTGHAGEITSLAGERCCVLPEDLLEVALGLTAITAAPGTRTSDKQLQRRRKKYPQSAALDGNFGVELIKPPHLLQQMCFYLSQTVLTPLQLRTRCCYSQQGKLQTVSLTKLWRQGCT